MSGSDAITWTLSTVLDLLSEIGVDHAIFGGLVTGCHGRERSTWDVDLLLPAGAMEVAARGLEVRGFTVKRFAHLAKFHDPAGRGVGGDFLSYQANRVLRAAFSSRTSAIILGRPVAVVSRAAFVALKFEAAATTARAPRDRIRDVSDIQGVLQREFSAEDEAIALDIAALMYPGAARDLASFLREVRQGRIPEIARRAARRPQLLIARAVFRARRIGR